MANPCRNTQRPHRSRLGEWNGFIYDDNVYPKYFMTSFYFRPSENEEHQFEASGKFYDTNYTVSGQCEQDLDGTISWTFVRTFSEKYETEYFHGHLSPDGSLVGTKGSDDKFAEHPCKFILKKTAAETMCHRPSPSEFEASKAQALWKFAIKAVRQQVLKERWSWQYFAARRDLRERYIQSELSLYYYGRNPDPDGEERTAIRQLYTAQDAMFVSSIFHYLLRILPWHV